MRKALLLALGAFAAACASAGTPESAPAPEPQQVAERQLTQRAFLRIAVDSLEPSAEQLQPLVDSLGGYVLSASAGERSAHYTVRVPAPRLESFLLSARTWGRVAELRVSAQDVTDAAADMDARIANLIAVRDRLRNYIERAGEVDDIIAVERELARVQGELDVLLGRRERMRRDVAFAAIDLELERKRVLGPLGAFGVAVGNLFSKLIFLR